MFAPAPAGRHGGARPAERGAQPRAHLVTTQPNYVNKVVFPARGAGLGRPADRPVPCGHGAILLLVLDGLFGTGFSATQLARRWCWRRFALLPLGLCWMFAALGVYLRDLAQLVGPLVMVTMFLGPVFYPARRCRSRRSPWLALNPITVRWNRCVGRGRWPVARMGRPGAVCGDRPGRYLFGLWASPSSRRIRRCHLRPRCGLLRATACWASSCSMPAGRCQRPGTRAGPAAEDRRRIGSVLMRIGAVSEDNLLQVLSRQLACW